MLSEETVARIVLEAHEATFNHFDMIAINSHPAEHVIHWFKNDHAPLLADDEAGRLARAAIHCTVAKAITGGDYDHSEQILALARFLTQRTNFMFDVDLLTRHGYVEKAMELRRFWPPFFQIMSAHFDMP